MKYLPILSLSIAFYLVAISTTAKGGLANHRSLEERAAKNAAKKLICYYDSWAAERPEKGRLTADKIDKSLCTHLIYNYATVGERGEVKPFQPKIALEEKKGLGMMKKFNKLKENNPNLKTLISINDGSEHYGKVTADADLRSKFVANIVKFIEEHKFDGVELSWRHPNDPRGLPEDKANYVLLVKELKEALKDKRYLLAASIAVGQRRVETGYEIGELSKYLDLMNLGTIDYNGSWDRKTGPSAPLYGSSKYDLSEKEAKLNVNHSVHYLLSLGAQPQKMMLGITTYGRTWNLEQASVNGLNAPTTSPAKPGPYVRNERLLGYNELCESFNNNRDEWVMERDGDYRVPYAHKDQLWVSYEDMDSVAEKAHYATAMKLGGVVVTGLDTDDFSGTCHDESYPLINSIKSALLD